MNKIWLMAIAAGCLLAFGSCKPKQSAYKAAYEQAKEKETTAPVTEATEPVDTYEEEEIAPVSKPKTTSTEATRTERINAAEGEDASRLKRYSVVIGSFKNKTNAYSLKERMQNEGYHAVLGENEQGMLRVIVSSFDDKADAAASRDAIKAKYAPNFQDAWLLERDY
ncbi:cell division protein [Parabacteroides sp. An277]|uniref:SPOR domain-containing protein n=1 Tax=Parabacteroides sp. An277 TaxID=1965619 RepID=UPI000B37633E|nr:SPOR domain-containing protein [Parabacteroides sp. An277]OUO49781.1 cell division protein [Parabacteroides sp. An277]